MKASEYGFGGMVWEMVWIRGEEGGTDPSGGCCGCGGGWYNQCISEVGA